MTFTQDDARCTVYPEGGMCLEAYVGGRIGWVVADGMQTDPTWEDWFNQANTQAVVAAVEAWRASR